MAEEKQEKLQIRLHVYDTDFPVNVKPDEEPLYRDAARLITNTVNSYASYFKGDKTGKELLYMALIEIALRYEREVQRNDTQPYDDILDKLTSEIEDALKR